MEKVKTAKTKGGAGKEKENEPMPMATGSGEIVKMEKDYKEECDEKLPKIKQLAATGKLNEALAELLVLEKQARTGGDMLSTGRVLVAVAELCFEAKNWELLIENVVTLSKRRGQLKQAVVKMVQEVCTYLDKLPTKQLQYDIIEALRGVTEGKIYVEVERARLTQRLAKMKEDEGKIKEAAEILQELQVETYGSMEKREKVELILEQMRYCLAKNDYIRTQIISKKINTKFFEDDTTHDLKIKFYTLMIEMDQHEASYLSICRHYRAILTTPSILADEAKKNDTLRSAVLYLILSPYDNEQSDLLHRMLADRSIERIPIYKKLLELFKNQEIISWTKLIKDFGGEIRNSEPGITVFDEKSEFGQKRWENLKSRVVEHNIRIMAKYYTRVTLTRMAELLDLSTEKVEEVLCSMVVSGQVQAKTDRPSGIVYFQDSKDPSEILNDWSHNVNNLMGLIARTTHLINKEEMVHKHLNLLSQAPSAVVSGENVPMDTN